MRVLKSCLIIILSVLLSRGTALAQQPHVVGAVLLDQMLAEKVRQQDADRAVIRDVLTRPQVREVAARAGLDIVRAEATVAMLDGKDLQEAAEQARQVQKDLAGGGTVTMSTTTIIIILLVVILVIVAVK